MLMYGPKVTDKSTPLEKISIGQMVAKIRKPNTELARYIYSLRKIIQLNYESYNQRKRSLPYVVPSIFSPPHRRLDNFLYSEHLIVDLDKLSEAGLKPEKLKQKLQTDSRIEVMFVSPSENGLKIFFRLNERISDTSQYSIFYKNFVHKFAQDYGLMQVVDLRTNDATRACFLSHDEQVYYNPNAEPVKIMEFVDFDNIAQTTQSIKQIEKDLKQKSIVKQQKDTLPPEIFTKIKQKLNPNYRPRQRERIITVPEPLNEIEQKIRDYIEAEFPQISLLNVKDINYGKQLLFKYDVHYAEFNIFFGKKGITLIKTNKKINNREFQELMYQLLNQILFNYDPFSAQS